MRRAASSRPASVALAIRRQPHRAAGAALALVVATLVLWTVAEILAIRADLDGARRGLLDVDVVTLAQEPGGVEALVSRAADQLASAERRARTSPVLGLWGRLPVVGDQIHGLRDITGALAGIGERARDAGDAIQVRIDGLDRGPRARVALLDEVLAQLEGLEAALRSADLGDAALIPPLDAERRELAAKLVEAVERLHDGQASVEAARRLVVGPTRYLLLAGNNSEMRGTPMPLAASILELRDGEITTDPFVQTSDLLLDPALAVDPPADLDELYEGLWGLGREWRTSTTTPRFPVAAELMADMARQTPIGEIDGVLLIDAIALGSMVDSVGGIQVDGETMSGEQVITEVLNQNYLELGTGAVRRQRAELQGQFARTAFDQLTEATDGVLDLAARLPDLAAGRHLLAWTPDPDVQSLWEDLGADGDLSAHSFMVSLQNASGSKRDWYLDPRVKVQGGSTVGGDALRVFVEVSLDNPVIRPTTDFIQGTSRFVRPGEHRSFVTVYLPGSAEDIRVHGDASFRAVGRDGASRVVTSWFRVPEGQTGSFVIELTLPSSDAYALIVPSARPRPMQYVVNGVEVLDSAPTVIAWIGSGDAGPTGFDRAVLAGLAGAVILVDLAALDRARRRSRPAVRSRPTRRSPALAG